MMKKYTIILALFFASLIYGKAYSQQIEIKAKETTNTGTPAYIKTSSEPFMGDCTYRLERDSIAPDTIYVSGKFTSDTNCTTTGALDSLNIGLLAKGSQYVAFSFIDETHDSLISFKVHEFWVRDDTAPEMNLKILPQYPSIYDLVRLVFHSEPYYGLCCFKQNVDSIKGEKIYVGGKYNSNCKCYDPVDDTLNLGALLSGEYEVIYSFIDNYTYAEYSDPLTTKYLFFNFTVTDTVRREIKLEIQPEEPQIKDSVYLWVYAEPFAGDCTYTTQLDSIVERKVYISGIYDGQERCISSGINTPFNLGLLPAGDYELEYVFTDTSGFFAPRSYATVFSVINDEIEIKVIPEQRYTSDTLYFVMSAEAFHGNCTYSRQIDSIVGANIYISGEYNGSDPCIKDDAISDTLKLGVFPSGFYNVFYTFTDISERFPQKAIQTNFTVEEVVGIEDIDSYKEFYVYPNPFQSYLNIKMPEREKRISLELYNIYGQMVYKGEGVNPNGVITIDVGHLGKGIYILSVIGEKTREIKVIKE